MLSFYLTAIKNSKEKTLYRTLRNIDIAGFAEVKIGKKKLVSFACNDYLGLSQNPRLKQAAIAAIEKYGVGAGSSRFITGNYSLYKKFEAALAKHKKCDDALVFSSGYACAIGTIPALMQDGDLIIADRLVHACLLDGARLSGARLMRFQHNAVQHCEQILLNHRQKFKKCLIITETVFSMDGDLGRVFELLAIAKKFECLLLSDDAHGLGCSIRSESELLNISHPNHLQMGTISKAFGAMGGYIAADKILIDYLRNFSRCAIYSTALPPAILAAAIESLKIISDKKIGIALANKTFNNAVYFCSLLGLEKPQSAIVIIKVGDNKKVLEIAKKAEEAGFLISAIRPPTVPTGSARLRITFCAFHQKSKIKALALCLKKLL